MGRPVTDRRTTRRTKRRPGSRERSSGRSEDEEEAEEEEEEDDFSQRNSTTALIRAELQRQVVGKKTMKVPTEPAPPASPNRQMRKVPIELLMPPPPTVLDRTLNSSVGRAATFAVTIVTFVLACVGLVVWQAPSRKQSGEDKPVFIVSLLAVAFMYGVVPIFARRTGMAPSQHGVDFKPYLACYRLAFFTAIPAFICLSLGYGAMNGFGEPEGGIGTVLLETLTPSSYRYFEAANGFIALNLTRGITETRQVTQHGLEGFLRQSRFRDAELRINNEPYSDVPEPTVPLGTIALHRIAPVFAGWADCVNGYRISGSCLEGHPVIAWAISQTDTLCSNLGMVACKPGEPILSPVYQCWDEKIDGLNYKGPVSGLCGRVVPPPPPGVIDELRALLLIDSWPASSLPNSTQVWVNVAPDPCIDHPKDCLARWSLIGAIGLVFMAISILNIAATAVMDCITDRRIRQAREVFEQYERSRKQFVI